MKKLFLIILSVCFVMILNAQDRNRLGGIGKDGDVTIKLIDSVITVYEDGSNSVLKFEIVNNNTYPIYIPHPTIKTGTGPQYFYLVNKSNKCVQEDSEMVVRDASEFKFIPANSSKEFELHKYFLSTTCLIEDQEKSINLVYKPFKTNQNDEYFISQLLKKNRDGRDIAEYLFNSKIKSKPIKLIYKK